MQNRCGSPGWSFCGETTAGVSSLYSLRPLWCFFFVSLIRHFLQLLLQYLLFLSLPYPMHSARRVASFPGGGCAENTANPHLTPPLLFRLPLVLPTTVFEKFSTLICSRVPPLSRACETSSSILIDFKLIHMCASDSSFVCFFFLADSSPSMWSCKSW